MEQTIIWKDGNHVCIRMLRRKNLPTGSGVIRRRCCCREGEDSANRLCVVHTLWPYLESFPVGTHPWARFAGDKANAELRRMLEALLVPEAASYRTHDMRRGHAEACCLMCMRPPFLHVRATLHQDMRLGGSSLYQILRAGQWRSAAFLDYLDKSGIEEVIAFDTAIDETLDWVQ